MNVIKSAYHFASDHQTALVGIAGGALAFSDSSQITKIAGSIIATASTGAILWRWSGINLTLTPSTIFKAFVKTFADKGFAYAQQENALMAFEGSGCKKDLIEARKYFKLAADQGKVIAQEFYAYMNLEGQGGGTNVSEAEKYFKLAADQGSMTAQYEYALILNSKGGAENRLEAKKHFKLAADQGHLGAQNIYANLAYAGKDFAGARKYFKMAADQITLNTPRKYAGTALRYAEMVYAGVGGDKDLVEARKYFKVAADQGYAEAQYQYARMAYFGNGGDKDPAEARKYFKLASDKRHSIAPLFYARMAYKGEGGEKNLVEARKYFELAAQEPLDVEAHYQYADMAYKGEGGTQNLFEARKYFKKAADLKYSNGPNVNPSFRYAMMLMKGEGGDKNIKEGIKYLQFAAKRGHIESQLELAQIDIKTRDDKISELSRLYADSKKEIVELKETNNTLTLQASMRTLPNTASCLFDKDRILSKFTCLISQDPCVAPVLDPIGNVLYEEDQILHWLKTNKTSPATNLPLTVEQLKPLPKLNALIQSRLEFLKSTSIEKGLKVLSNQKAIQEAYAEMKEHCPELLYLFDNLLMDLPSLEALDLHKPVRDKASVRPHHEYLDLAK